MVHMWPPLTVLPEETFCLKTAFADKALCCFCAQEKSLKPQHILANNPPPTPAPYLRHQEVLLMGREGMSEVLDFLWCSSLFRSFPSIWGSLASRAVAFSLQDLHLIFNKSERQCPSLGDWE